MIGLLGNEQVAVFTQQTAQRTLVNDAVIFQPKQAQDIGIAVEQQPDEFPQLIEDAIPIRLPIFRRRPAGQIPGSAQSALCKYPSRLCRRLNQDPIWARTCREPHSRASKEISTLRASD